MRLSICYLTGRSAPRLDWLLEALARQRQSTDVLELIVVDACERTSRELGCEAVRGIADHVIVVPPKPNRWQGRYRATLRDSWAKSQAANTALCLASHDYVAFLDDRSVPGERWLATIRDGSFTRAAVLAGAYKRLFGEGREEIDHRLALHPEGKEDCGGAWLYGCTFALPLKWALEVNGFEEGMDGLAQEDCVFGSHLKNAGRRIDFVPSLFVELHREVGTDHVFERARGNKLDAALKRFCLRRRTEFTPDLEALRSQLRSGGSFPIPDPRARDWFNDRPIDGSPS